MWSNFFFCFKSDFRVWMNLIFLVIAPTHPQTPSLVLLCLTLVFSSVCLYLPQSTWQNGGRTGMWDVELVFVFFLSLTVGACILSSNNIDHVAFMILCQQIFPRCEVISCRVGRLGEVVYYTVSLVCSYPEVLTLYS